MTIELNQYILARIAQVRKDADTQEANWIEARAVAVPVLEKLIAMGAEPYFIYNDTIYASVTGDVHQLTDAIRALRTGGYKANSKPERKSSTYNAFFKHTTSGVDIYLAFSSSVCRRVKVGTKTETVDVYEIHCGESDEFSAEPVA